MIKSMHMRLESMAVVGDRVAITLKKSEVEAGTSSELTFLIPTREAAKWGAFLGKPIIVAIQPFEGATKEERD